MTASTAQRVKYGVFVNDDNGETMNHIVDVGAANEHVNYVQDCLHEGTIADLDPLNQLIMLEEMEWYEALELIQDLYRTIKGKS